MSSTNFSVDGKQETERLKQKIQKQLQKFFDTLQDLEDEKEELEEEEIELIKQETMEQMEEFEKTLTKLTSGDMSLVNELGKMRLAMQLSVSEAFQTPEVISMFAKQEPKLLREKLTQLQRDVKLGKISQTIVTQQTVEILSALKKLGEKLSDVEKNFLDQNITQELKYFVAVDDKESIRKSN
eukprot:gene5564-9382_t